MKTTLPQVAVYTAVAVSLGLSLFFAYAAGAASDRAHRPPLSIREPCVIVDQREDPDGLTVKFMVFCTEYRGGPDPAGQRK